MGARYVMATSTVKEHPMKSATAMNPITLPLQRPQPPARKSCRSLDEARALQQAESDHYQATAGYRTVDSFLSEFRTVAEQVRAMDESDADFAWEAKGQVVLSKATLKSGDRIDAELSYNPETLSPEGFSITLNPNGIPEQKFIYERSEGGEKYIYQRHGMDGRTNDVLVMNREKGILTYTPSYQPSGHVPGAEWG